MSMNKIIFAIAGFVVGIGAGGAIGYVIGKKKSDKQHQLEMDKVWADLQADKEPKEQPKVQQVATALDNSQVLYSEKPDLAEYAAKIRNSGYEPPKDLKKTDDSIHEIEYQDLDEDNYERIDLILYADGIIADDQDYPLRNLYDSVGENIHEIMNGRDEIYIRNEKRKIDYDICRSMLTYGELLDRHPETEQKLQYDDALQEYYENEEEEDEEE